MRISRIEIDFPFETDVRDTFVRELTFLLSGPCMEYERNAKASGGKMWVSFVGEKPVRNPLASEGEGLETDSTILYIGISHREDGP